MNLSDIEIAKNKNIQSRFETKELGSVSRVYSASLVDGTSISVIFNEGETLQEAICCLEKHYGKRLASVKHGC